MEIWDFFKHAMYEILLQIIFLVNAIPHFM